MPGACKQKVLPCSCGCCTVQSRGDGVRWGRTGDSPGEQRACAPIFYGQHSPNEGFTDCEQMLNLQGSFCQRETSGFLLSSARSGTLDMSRFCFYQCIPASLPPEGDVGNGGECVPATREVLEAAAMRVAGEKDRAGSAPARLPLEASSIVGGGADLGAVS